MNEIESLEQAIQALETQRALLGDAVVEAGLAPMRERLQSLRRQGAEQQRKQVTILFADASGFTAASALQDPEEVTETMNALWQRVDGVILEYGGTIDKHIGDAVMAVWGMTTTSEDDAERAVRAALSMQQVVKEANLQLGGSPLQIRIGLHSGMAFLGAVGAAGEYTVMGDTVNTASRLQHVAPVGGVILSNETYQLVRGIFDVQPLDPVRLEGKTEPMQAYLALRAKQRAFRMSTRGLEGIRTRMIGRAAELFILQNALQSVMTASRHQVITVIGDAGIGKSRLLYEFENWLELQSMPIRYFKGRASPETQRLPYGLLRNMFAFRFQINETDSPAAARQKFEQGVAAVLSTLDPEQAAIRAHFIGQLIGFDFSASPYLQGVDAQQLRNRAYLYLTEFVRAAAQLTMVLFLEDIHWADDSSLNLLTTLLSADFDRSLLVVCLARPTLYERYADWGTGLPRHTPLRLNALSRDDSRLLVTEILQKAGQVPEVLREMVVGGAEGNPFYVEELIKMLIEDGVIVKGEEEWQIDATRLVQVRVPGTLAGVLQARLDSLGLAERHCLQQASVIGRVFWDDALAHLAGEGIDLTTALQTLVQRELIFQRPISVFAGAHEYTFKHALLREVTYESVLKRDRRIYHARAAEWLLAHGGERSREYTGLVAQHLELAGETIRASILLLQAGQQAAQHFANSEALQYLDRALALTPAANQSQRFEILMAQENVLNLLGHHAVQVSAALDVLQSLAEEMGSPNALAAAALRRSSFAEINGDYPTAIQAGRTAVEQARLAGNPAQEAEGYYLWGRGLWRQGRLDEALESMDRALEKARPAGVLPVQAGALRTMGAIQFHQGNYSQVFTIYEEAIKLYTEIGDRRGYGSAVNNLGDINRQLGNYVRAREYFEQALHTSREIGERWSECIGLLNLCLVAQHQNDPPAALDYAQQALNLAQESGYRSAESFALVGKGNALLALDRLDEALASIQASIDLRTELGEQNMIMESRSTLARVHLAQQDIPAALAQVEIILNYLQQNSVDGADEPFRIYLTCCHVLQAAADPRYPAVLQEALRLLQAQADRITDPDLHQSFLCNVAAHMELVRLAAA